MTRHPKIGHNRFMPEKENDKNRVKVKVVEESSNNLHSEESREHDQHPHEEEDHDEKKHEHEHDHEEHEDDDEKEERKENNEPTPSYPKQDKIPTWILFFAFLIGLVLGAGLIGGIFYYRSKVGNIPIIPAKENKVAEATIEPSPSATPEAKLDLSAYSVEILNGAGIAGEAAKVEEMLNDYGFSDTTTGNASNYDFQDTEVALKEGVPSELFDDVKSAMEGYSVVKVDNLPSSSSYDIVITVGQSKS